MQGKFFIMKDIMLLPMGEFFQPDTKRATKFEK